MITSSAFETDGLAISQPIFERSFLRSAKLIVPFILGTLFVLDVSPALAIIKNDLPPKELISLLKGARKTVLDDRIAYLETYPSIISFYPTWITGKEMTGGFFIQGTEHSGELAAIGDAIEGGG